MVSGDPIPGGHETFYFSRCITAAFCSLAASMVSAGLLSSLLGNVVSKANDCVAYCGRALRNKRTDGKSVKLHSVSRVRIEDVRGDKATNIVDGMRVIEAASEAAAIGQANLNRRHRSAAVQL